MESGTLHAFDHAAPGYEAGWDARPTVRFLRGRVASRCAERWLPGAKVLDLGCGTGADARVLGGLGYAVTAVDGSPGMVAVARGNGVDARVVPLSRVSELQALGPFDGLLSDFGALNCAPDLAALNLASLLRPGGVAVIVTISPSCPAEALALCARGRPRAAWRRRRSGPVPVGEGEATVRYWSVPELVAGLAPLRLVDVEALGALFPPPDLGEAPAALLTLDAALARLPGVRRWGDHTLTVWERP